MEKYKKTIGRFGEDLAEKFLLKRGYKIIARNLKIGRNELDIIALINEEMVFVEVKTLASGRIGPANEALKGRQIKNLKRAMSVYAWECRHNQEKIRLDFISIDLNRRDKTAKLKHYKDII